MYLPQFHRVKENDEWWGEGFTEWTTVSNAKQLYDGHYQPRIPLNNNYYDLLNYNTFVSQEKLMHKYGIYGMCFYHYWFENGRQILEKPMENLLKWRDINIPYCFSWANETWARTWSNLSNANTWTSEYEKKVIENNDGVLLKQKYGYEAEWKEHFNYLLKFFKDDRYIKVNNKPLIMIYKTKDISCLENMLELWGIMARENGFDGIYVIGKDARKSQINCLNKTFISEPGHALKKCDCQMKNGVACYNYEDVWNEILKENYKNNLVGGFVGYDDTPRHGKNGIVIENATPETFEEYFIQLILLNKKYNNEYVFLNAWNEWGEGMYLEPDEKYKYKFLEAVKNCTNNTRKEAGENSFDCVNDMDVDDKETCLKNILDKWLDIIEKDGNIDNVLSKLKKKKIAIYGYGMLGRHFIAQLIQLNYDVVYVVDRRKNIESNIPLYGLDDKWPESDYIIVTAAYEYGEIYRYIKQKDDKIKIVSLEHLIMDY